MGNNTRENTGLFDKDPMTALRFELEHKPVEALRRSVEEDRRRKKILEELDRASHEQKINS